MKNETINISEVFDSATLAIETSISSLQQALTATKLLNQDDYSVDFLVKYLDSTMQQLIRCEILIDITLLPDSLRTIEWIENRYKITIK